MGPRVGWIIAFLAINWAKTAPGAAKSDFGQQGWIDTLGLKQIFLISSALIKSLSTQIGKASMLGPPDVPKHVITMYNQLACHRL